MPDPELEPAAGIRSMTGFGAASGDLPRGRLSVTARSVNHRYLDLSVSLPRSLAALEAPVKQLVQRRLTRGRVEVFVRAAFEPGQESVVKVSRQVAAGVVAALRELKQEHGLAGEVGVTELARFPGAIEVIEGEPATDPDLAEGVLGVARQALEELEKMRCSEGERLAVVLRGLLDEAAASAEKIAAVALEERAARREGLQQRVRELVGELGLDEARLYQEVVRLVDRGEIQEELDRLRSHVVEARRRVEEGGACGKSLDFLAQELMREANTMGSKSGSAPLTREVVALKAGIEKFREQVQNVE